MIQSVVQYTMENYKTIKIMNFLELSNLRQSVRKYSVKKVEPEKIERCIEAARIAPSACNAQPWKYIVIDNPEIKNKIANATYDAIMSFNKFVPQAPVIVALITEKPNFTSQIGGWLKNKEFNLIDVGITAVNFCLQATEEGLGTCMLGWFNEKKVIQVLEIPKNKRPVLLISVGYAEENYKQRIKIRKDKNDIVCYNKYSFK
jgi:nitroreductase